MYIPISVYMHLSMCVCVYAGKNVCIKYNTLLKKVTASCKNTLEMVLCCPPQSSSEGWACLPPTNLPPSLLCQRLSITASYRLPCPTPPKNSGMNHKFAFWMEALGTHSLSSPIPQCWKTRSLIHSWFILRTWYSFNFMKIYRWISQTSLSQ